MSFVNWRKPSLTSEVENLKAVVHLALMMNDPENSFEKSDYYGFVQRLFIGDSQELKADLTVLSFNYDPYLDFLLDRAYVTRCQVGKKAVDLSIRDSINSGDCFPAQLDPNRFALLKMHGTIVPTVSSSAEAVTIQTLFKDALGIRLERLIMASNRGDDVSPIHFPWEIITEDGKLMEQGGRIENGSSSAIQKSSLTLHHERLRHVWCAAQKAIYNATKVSFIGLSYHRYLDPGFRFLFQNRNCDLEIVSADTSNAKYEDPGDDSFHHPSSSASRLIEMLVRVAPNVRPSRSKHDPSKIGLKKRVTVRFDFEDFILHELRD